MTRADGLVTFRDINAHLDCEQRNRDLDRPELIDAGAATDLTAEQVRRLVHRAADMIRIVDLGPTAIVTTDDVVYGMARMYSTVAEGIGAAAEVFRDLESAVARSQERRGGLGRPSRLITEEYATLAVRRISSDRA